MTRKSNRGQGLTLIMTNCLRGKANKIGIKFVSKLTKFKTLLEDLLFAVHSFELFVTTGAVNVVLATAESISTGFGPISILAKALGEGSEGARIGPGFLLTGRGTGLFLWQYYNIAVLLQFLPGLHKKQEMSDKKLVDIEENI